ncbi:MAG: phosphatase PAP2 family protein [Parcubacteria group bacterium]
MDLYIFQWINNFAGKNIYLDSAAIFFAEYFQYVIGIILLIVILKNFKKNLAMSISVISAVFLSRVVITEAIRYFFPISRPFVAMRVNQLLSHSESASLPSGHAALFFALAAAAYFYNKKLGIFFFISAFLISISRVFAGIHWPSDILAGALVGIFSGWLANKLLKKFFQAKTPQ